MTTPGIVVQGVQRSFGQVQAVRNVTLRADAGRVTGLVGPNGSGKTTLLLMLASLLAPDAGSIRIDGIDPVTDPHAARAVLGWMPDALGAWNSLTSRETLVVTARLYGMPIAAASVRADALLTEVGLVDLADAPARVLSRGQKQRLGLARALVHDPRVLLLDEPASGLDPQARIDLRLLLRRFAAEGRTVLVSSHILSELEEVVDDAVFLMAGVTVDPARVEAASRRARPWRVRLAGAEPSSADVQRVAGALRVPVESLGVDRRDVVVSFESEDAAAAALRDLVSAGLDVVEFAAAQGALERTFLDLGDGRPPQQQPTQPGTVPPGAAGPRTRLRPPRLPRLRVGASKLRTSGLGASSVGASGVPQPRRRGGRERGDLVNGQRLGTIVGLELTQRTRSVAWYVLLGVFALLLMIVTALSFVAWSSAYRPGGAIYSTIVYVTLLLVVLVSPTLSGNAINGDRDAATLAPVQITLATTAEILIGKFLAAWVAGLAFVVVSVPFLAIAILTGGGAPATIAVSLLVLTFEVGIIAAIGVALSGILSRPLFSVGDHLPRRRGARDRHAHRVRAGGVLDAIGGDQQLPVVRVPRELLGRDLPVHARRGAQRRLPVR